MRSVLLVAAMAGLCAPAFAQEPADPGPRGIAAAERRTVPLTIRTKRGPVAFRVEVARSAEAQQLGLMYRRHMGARHGMIFPKARAEPTSFWMKNTYIPLDLLFIRADGTVSSIAANATPLSTDTINSIEPVTTVLELNGGAARRFGIRPGDRVRW